ncbi:MAG: uncharacterized protein KVP18_001972 [Porospora cf. gigantea A]|uniref:uncharacterized protein n=1 Tax=Porospora cf. gigantea A TaxID=2853593 RepID=UPI00355AC280|nr:MAG: hypothetical protein KVP18_001972 [Porospora cf. gigantea A]
MVKVKARLAKKPATPAVEPTVRETTDITTMLKAASKKKPPVVTKTPVAKKTIEEDLGLEPQRRLDTDGWPIFSLEELNVGQGGGTDLCPFDCECCF